ncbi:MAG: hypothetical protein N2447_02345, partial [Thermoanaerobaculum sp.]|nr:hypothetical protein [Thermoanaerobaculum sp.]
FLRARTAYRLARWEEALQWFQLAKTSAPTAEDWRRSALFAARAWEQLGQEDCAEETYREQTRAYPDELDGWHGLLMVLA